MSCNTLSLRANAKVNLALDILGKRNDGYHQIDMINRSVSLHDTVELTLANRGGVRIEIEGAPYLPADERNLTVRAAFAVAEAAGIRKPSLRIRLKKRIPSQAGLGGGSADAAAVLVGLNELWQLNYSEQRLRAIGLSLGADIPFCISGGCARVGGIGEEIEPIADAGDYALLLAMGTRGRSTRTAFAAYDDGLVTRHPDIGLVARHLADGDIGQMALAVDNAFYIADPDEEMGLLLAAMMKNGALGGTMTGSGSAVFGIFSTPLAAQRCCDAMCAQKRWAFSVQPAAAGVEIIFRR